MSRRIQEVDHCMHSAVFILFFVSVSFRLVDEIILHLCIYEFYNCVVCVGVIDLISEAGCVDDCKFHCERFLFYLEQIPSVYHGRNVGLTRSHRIQDLFHCCLNHLILNVGITKELADRI
jgi:hypothetical protein